MDPWNIYAHPHDWVQTNQSGSTLFLMDPDKTQPYLHRAESRFRRDKHRDDSRNLTQARDWPGPAHTRSTTRTIHGRFRETLQSIVVKTHPKVRSGLAHGTTHFLQGVPQCPTGVKNIENVEVICGLGVPNHRFRSSAQAPTSIPVIYI